MVDRHDMFTLIWDKIYIRKKKIENILCRTLNLCFFQIYLDHFPDMAKYSHDVNTLMAFSNTSLVAPNTGYDLRVVNIQLKWKYGLHDFLVVGVILQHPFFCFLIILMFLRHFPIACWVTNNDHMMLIYLDFESSLYCYIVFRRENQCSFTIASYDTYFKAFRFRNQAQISS